MRTWEAWESAEKFMYIRLTKQEAYALWIALAPENDNRLAVDVDKELGRFQKGK